MKKIICFYIVISFLAPVTVSAKDDPDKLAADCAFYLAVSKRTNHLSERAIKLANNIPRAINLFMEKTEMIKRSSDSETQMSLAIYRGVDACRALGMSTQ